MTARTLLNRLLLRHNVSTAQTVGFAVAALLGMAILLSSLLFIGDLRTAMDRNHGAADYVQIARPVTGLGSLMDGEKSFTAEQIARLKSHPGIADVGEITAARFDVFASLEAGGRRLSTALFLEGIPDRMLDVKPPGWEDTIDLAAGDPIPVIISKDYLSLYNNSFAPSRGMPQVSEAMVSSVPLRLQFWSPQGVMAAEARIVGFSSRLSTIAVPERLLRRLNREMGVAEAQPNRLILKLRTPGDPAVMDFIRSEGYEPAGDRAATTMLSRALQLAAGIVAVIGVIICVLALFILLLSIKVLLQNSREKIRDLILLGYLPKDIMRVYMLRFLTVNLIATVGAVVVAIVARSLWLPTLEAIGMEQAPMPLALIVAAPILLVILTISPLPELRRSIRRAE